MDLNIVILAAGQGKRMASQSPKVMQPLGGRSLIQHVVTTAKKIAPHLSPIIIYGHQGHLLQEHLSHETLLWVEQKEQLGTGHAVLQALPYFKKNERVLILYGDVPLTSPHTLQQFIMNTPNEAIGILTASLPNPYGYGRIIRNEKGHIIKIIEEKDADQTQKYIKEINSGIYIIPHTYLVNWLPKLSNQNNQKEQYLTEIISFAANDGLTIQSMQIDQQHEIQGVNNRSQLAELERQYQKQIAEQLMQQGVTIMDPTRFDVRGEVEVGQDVLIDINVILEGKVSMGSHCIIGPHVILKNVKLGNNVHIKSNTVIEDAEIGDHAIIGPFARIRPETKLGPHTHVGNFVEIKKSSVGEGSKINHLSYIGDCLIGKQVNIGAGTITCNYDGANKHQTIIQDNAFIGSNTALVAPVTIYEGATIGAGSTITADAPAHHLSLSRSKQSTISHWERPAKKTVT